MKNEFPDVIAVDFETHPILQRPNYPPEPVGVSIRWPDMNTSTYWAWGHLDENNCSKAEGVAALQMAWDSGLPLLFHNSKFDVAVATERLGLRMKSWDQYHDSMFLAYLADPHNRALGLKELAAEVLGWPQDEKDAVVEWVLANQKMLTARYPHLRELRDDGTPKDTIKPSKAGAWIFAAPGRLVSSYAEGDTDRTLALFQTIYPHIIRHGMGYAYDTERELMPILMENELTGMRTDVQRLEQDVEGYGWALDTAEDWLRAVVGIG